MADQCLINATPLKTEACYFSKGDAVTLKYPKRHPKNIAIQTPSGLWYSVQSVDDKISIMPQEDFQGSTELTLDPQSLVGVTFKDGVRVQENVFTQYGKYLIYMADNLETEPENTFNFKGAIFWEAKKP